MSQITNPSIRSCSAIIDAPSLVWIPDQAVWRGLAPGFWHRSANGVVLARGFRQGFRNSMNQDLQHLGQREKLILAGLFLAKFDTKGLQRLGFESFVEAFNVLGYALGGRPARIKNYRDEFDPLFPNARKGWHKRPRRSYCVEVFESFESLGLEAFTALIQSFVGLNPKLTRLPLLERWFDFFPSSRWCVSQGFLQVRLQKRV